MEAEGEGHLHGLGFVAREELEGRLVPRADAERLLPAVEAQVSAGALPAAFSVLRDALEEGSERALEVLAVVRNTNNPDGVGLEFQARDMGGVHRLREVIRRLVEQ